MSETLPRTWLKLPSYPSMQALQALQAQLLALSPLQPLGLRVVAGSCEFSQSLDLDYWLLRQHLCWQLCQWPASTVAELGCASESADLLLSCQRLELLAPAELCYPQPRLGLLPAGACLWSAQRSLGLLGRLMLRTGLPLTHKLWRHWQQNPLSWQPALNRVLALEVRVWPELARSLPAELAPAVTKAMSQADPLALVVAYVHGKRYASGSASACRLQEQAALTALWLEQQARRQGQPLYPSAISVPAQLMARLFVDDTALHA